MLQVGGGSFSVFFVTSCWRGLMHLDCVGLCGRLDIVGAASSADSPPESALEVPQIPGDIQQKTGSVKFQIVLTASACNNLLLRLDLQ